MHNQTFQNFFLPMQRLTGRTQISIKSGKMLIKGKFLPILSFFPFLSDENMLKHCNPQT